MRKSQFRFIADSYNPEQSGPSEAGGADASAGHVDLEHLTPHVQSGASCHVLHQSLVGAV